MEIDPADLTPRQAYRLLTGVVVPRPIAWVSSLDAAGHRNLAPHSYFNIISTDPPIVHFTSSGVKDSLRNVTATGEFVVNVVTEDLVEAMNLTAASFADTDDEFAWADLDAAESTRVAPPRVAEAKVALECRHRQTVTMGNGHMVFGDVLAVQLATGLWDGDRIDPLALPAVGRLAGSGYASVTDVYELARPSVEDVHRHGAR